MKTIHIFSAIAMIGCTLMACQPNEPAAQYITNEQADQAISSVGGKLLQLDDLKKYPYMTAGGNYCDSALYRLRAWKVGDSIAVYSIDTIPTDQPLFIRGRITTDDMAGNFYKAFCIQQIVNGVQQGLRISVDASSIGGMYQLGQEIQIRVDGLAIGRYANQPQLCVPNYDNANYKLHQDQKQGWAPGRIPFGEFRKRTQLIGLPQAPVYDTMLISDFVNLTDPVAARMIDGRLVCLKDVHYTGSLSDNGTPKQCSNGDPATDKEANVFAPTTENNNYPQSRIIADQNGNQTLVSVSEYAKFAKYYLPGANRSGISGCASYEGTIVGIIGYYRDQAANAPAWDDWSITIRSMDDLKLYHTRYGGEWTRIEYGY
ncbi:MAG: hypothetical protein IJ838_07880 [Paludibacteraceae bacterium]|nr:hypothetical protein [Paludibacteraceae bacterium]